MNLQKLFELQRQLDERIIREKGLEGKDLLPNTILALQVELGELANEWRGFKYWSNDQKPRTRKPIYNVLGGTIGHKNAVLEEYVDCLHFVLSIGLKLNEHNFDWFREYEANKMPGWYLSDTITEQFNEVFFRVSFLLYKIDMDDYSSNLYGDVICYYLGLGEMLGFTWDQIEAAYMKKNAENHRR